VAHGGVITMWMLVIGLAVVSVLSSTRADRERARRWIKPWEPMLLLATLLFWGAVFWPDLVGQSG
jgi:hypothetical protein